MAESCHSPLSACPRFFTSRNPRAENLGVRIELVGAEGVKPHRRSAFLPD